MNFIVRLIATALSTAAAVWLVPGINLSSTDRADQVMTLLLVALIFGVVNALVKPLATVVGACFVILTLGLFMLVINALMLLLTSWLAEVFGVGFHVDGFWPAFWGALIISIVGSILGGIFGSSNKQNQHG